MTVLTSGAQRTNQSVNWFWEYFFCRRWLVYFHYTYVICNWYCTYRLWLFCIWNVICRYNKCYSTSIYTNCNLISNSGCFSPSAPQLPTRAITLLEFCPDLCWHFPVSLVSLGRSGHVTPPALVENSGSLSKTQITQKSPRKICSTNLCNMDYLRTTCIIILVWWKATFEPLLTDALFLHEDDR